MSQPEQMMGYKPAEDLHNSSTVLKVNSECHLYFTDEQGSWTADWEGRACCTGKVFYPGPRDKAAAADCRDQESRPIHPGSCWSNIRLRHEQYVVFTWCSLLCTQDIALLQHFWKFKTLIIWAEKHEGRTNAPRTSAPPPDKHPSTASWKQYWDPRPF